MMEELKKGLEWFSLVLALGCSSAVALYVGHRIVKMMEGGKSGNRTT